MRGLISSLVALAYCVAIAALLYMSASPALEREAPARGVVAASTAQPL